jgi:hypothetical protein
LIDVASLYAGRVSEISIENNPYLAGTTDLKPLVVALTGASEPWPGLLSWAAAAAGLIAMVLVFRRSPHDGALHFSALALFSLWSVYHRSYDAVVCIVPLAVFVRNLRRSESVGVSLALLALLVPFMVGVPGLLTDRLKLAPQQLASPVAQAGLHLERVTVLLLFCACLWLLWRDPRTAASR